MTVNNVYICSAYPTIYPDISARYVPEISEFDPDTAFDIDPITPEEERDLAISDLEFRAGAIFCAPKYISDEDLLRMLKG